MGVEKIVGLIGWPLSHSVSPSMHNRAFLSLGLSNWLYVLLPVSGATPLRVREAVKGLRALGLRGANVTVPHKEAVIPHLDGLSDEAKIIGAVNTIAIDHEGHLIGHNTDGHGFINDLFDHGIDVRDMRVAILGAGGSARAIAYALLAHGCRDLLILNRTISRADSLAHSLGCVFSNAVQAYHLDEANLLRREKCDLVINATSLGLTANSFQWDKYLPLTSHQIVYDLVYNPLKTSLLEYAEHAGAKAIGGLGMLIHQGAEAFKLWTGFDPPLDVMRKAAMEELNKRA